MRLTHKLGAVTIFSLFGALAWFGCTDDEAPASSKDAGSTNTNTNKDGSTSNTTDGSTTNPDGGGGPQSISCQNYCAQIATSCTGANQQYPSQQACLNTCNNNRMLTGTAGETATATLACRQYHAGVAATDPATHCPHAGPSGGGQCGSRCEAFCRFASDPTVGFCKYVDAGIVDAGIADADPDAEAGPPRDAGPGLGYTPPYTDVNSCLAACANFTVNAQGEQYNSSAGGNTFNCRMYHLVNGIGIGNGPAGKTHCDHVGVTSTPCQ